MKTQLVFIVAASAAPFRSVPGQATGEAGFAGIASKSGGGQGLNDFLALLVCGGRTGFESALNKTGIMLQEIERDDSRQHREEKPKNHASQKCRVQAGPKSITAMTI
jgi:hypothetical protein